VTVHDSLSGDSLDRHYSNMQAQELGVEASFDHCFVFSEPLMDHGHLFLMNPATGLPMVDDFVDAGGNTFGFGRDDDTGW